jgi:DmsE family decaheme c-type cytochrome
MKCHGWSAGSALLVTCALIVATAQPSVTQTAPSTIGSDACRQCHEEEWTSYASSVHGHAEHDSTVLGVTTGCESCHGPGSLHAEAAGDRSNPGFATIRNFATANPQEASAACRRCHTAGEPFYWEQSTHARRNLSCVSCHSIHHPQSVGAAKLLKFPDINHQCLSCHKDKRAGLARSAHMPLREGAMTCADCHNPHGTTSEKQLRAATVNDLCTSCHADKRGPFLWEHPPVRENCLNCHQPHGSNNDKVLASRRPFLCQRCHITTRHPSTLYDNPDLVSNRLFNRSCTNCHSQIHGSNHPSGKTFLR